MNELEQIWTQKLTEARIKARATGREDVADYLALRATNDMIRQTSVKWLFESLLEIAAEANRSGANIQIETENRHRFQYENSSLAGSLARLSQGVRCLTVEAGWTRTPADGFMRGGALAAARLAHFGMSKHNAELSLVLANDLPAWFAVAKNGRREPFDAKDLQRHSQIFLA
ncbi:MAG: hypothetical protein LH614_12625 [Pyrinomonadaceae bacterium]|nr:hypothetical protein [Pyrinomonadaceae bacterium]